MNRQYMSDLQLFMRRSSYFVELYHGHWISCEEDTTDEGCPDINSDLPAHARNQVTPRIFEFIERHRVGLESDDFHAIPFEGPDSEALHVSSDDYQGWDQCAVYGDNRAEGASQKLGMEFSKWRWPSNEVDASNWISAESATSSNDALTTEAFRAIFKHHSQFKCVQLLDVEDFENACTDPISTQDSYLYIGDANDVNDEICPSRPEQRLYKSDEDRTERFARQSCTLATDTQPTYESTGASLNFTSSTGTITDLKFDCDHDNVEASPKVQWAIVGYRENQDTGLRAADDNPMDAYVRGCINESVAQRSRFFRECAGYGIFDEGIAVAGQAVVSCDIDYDCRAFRGTECHTDDTCRTRDGSNLGAADSIKRYNNSVDADVTCSDADTSVCRTGETCSGGYCRDDEGQVVNRRRDAIKLCIDDMFNRDELQDDTATAPALPEKMRGPYVCHGFDYDANDPTAFKASAGSSSNEYNGMLRCGCVDGYEGVNEDGALDCSFGCLPEHLLREGEVTERDWFDQATTRYDKFIKPPYDHWICMEPGVNGYESATAPAVACSANAECVAPGYSCVDGFCARPDTLDIVEAGVPAVIMMDIYDPAPISGN
jgi:hypothetical protein